MRALGIENLKKEDFIDAVNGWVDPLELLQDLNQIEKDLVPLMAKDGYTKKGITRTVQSFKAVNEILLVISRLKDANNIN